MSQTLTLYRKVIQKYKDHQSIPMFRLFYGILYSRLDDECFQIQKSKSGVDLKLGRETLSLAFPSSGMRQAFR